jgi:1,4-dihydroxy-2-naphthoate octaprenyltransferase
MKPWMLYASLLLQIIGLVWAPPLGLLYCAIYASTMVLSIFYSTPGLRWKGHPLLSLVAVGVGTGTNTFLLGYLAAGSNPIDARILLAALGVAAMLLSLYPVSQIYQLEADRRRNDRTFAVAYGLIHVKLLFYCAFPLGLAAVTTTLAERHDELGLAFAFLGLAGGIGIATMVTPLRGEASEYKKVMRLKYFASMSFTLFAAAAIVLVHR